VEQFEAQAKSKEVTAAEFRILLRVVDADVFI
jgi:hypothetical protein